VPDSSDFQKRLELVRRLNNLPGPQLGQLIFILDPPAGNVPPPSAAPAERIEALLAWAQHPTMGCGLDPLEQVLNGIDHAKPADVIKNKSSEVAADVSKLKEYQQAVAQLVEEACGFISDRGRLFLNSLQNHLAIAPEDAQRIESDCLSPYESYKDLVKGLYEQGYPFDEEAKGILQRSQNFLKLNQEVVAQIEKRALWGDDDLSSEKSIDYGKLRWLLKAQNWKAADRETYEVMIRAVGKKSGQLVSLMMSY
jgi:hypothetical protein